MSAINCRYVSACVQVCVCVCNNMCVCLCVVRTSLAKVYRMPDAAAGRIYLGRRRLDNCCFRRRPQPMRPRVALVGMAGTGTGDGPSERRTHESCREHVNGLASLLRPLRDAVASSDRPTNSHTHVPPLSLINVTRRGVGAGAASVRTRTHTHVRWGTRALTRSHTRSRTHLQSGRTWRHVCNKYVAN